MRINAGLRGALEIDIEVTDRFFAGETKDLYFEVFAAGADLAAASAAMRDVTGWSLRWSLRRAAVGSPHRVRLVENVVNLTTVAGDIAIVGTYNVDRAINTQRVVVHVPDVSTQDLPGGIYVHALKRIDAGLGADLVFGTLQLLTSAA